MTDEEIQDKKIRNNKSILEFMPTLENWYMTEKIPETIQLEKERSMIYLYEYNQNEWKKIEGITTIKVGQIGRIIGEFVLQSAGQGQFTLLADTQSIHKDSKLRVEYGKKVEKLRMEIINDLS